MLSPVFTLAIPEHRCKIADLSGDTYAVQGEWHQRLINQSIPWIEKDDGWTLATCRHYIEERHTVFDNFSHPVNASVESCNAWVYDQSIFRSTFITKENLVCGKEFARANANMILMGGVLFGAIIMGIFSDIFGRKTALLVSAFLHISGGCGSAFAPNYETFVFFRFIVGMSNMGIFMSAFVIGVELVGPSRRVFAGIVIEFFWCIGLYLLNIIAFLIRDWNILQLVIVAFTPLMVAYVWIIPESPRWLLSRGKTVEAEEIIQKCARVNGIKLPGQLIDSYSAVEGEKQSVLKMFTSTRLLLRTVVIYFNWCVVSMVYYGLGLNVGNLDGDIYVNFAINTSMEVAAYIVCLLVLERIGRKPLHAGTMILGGAACLCTIFTVLYADKSMIWTTVVLANVGKFGVSAAFAIIYVWSAELFPTMVRNSGMGSSSMMARVGGMLSPYIADLGNLVDGDFGTALPLLIFGGLSVLAGVTSLLLPETRGKILPESIHDAQVFGRHDAEESPTTGHFTNQSSDNLTNSLGTGVGMDNAIFSENGI